MKQFKIQATSLTTDSKKWFYFNELELKEFENKRFTNYPAWIFNDSSLIRI